MPRTLSHFALSLLAAALLSMTLASCGSDLLNLDQSWALVTVRDSTLPYSVPNSAQNGIIVSGVADLNSDDTYTTTFTGTTNGVAGQVGQDHGKWSVVNSTIVFHSSTGTDYLAGIQGSSFLATIPGQFLGSTDATFDMIFTKE